MSEPLTSPSAEAPLPLPQRRGGAGPLLRRRFLLPAIRLAALAILAGVALSTPGFLSAPSLLSLLTTVSFIGCVAVGMTLITISGNIMSFSLSATVGATAMIFIVGLNHAGLAGGLVAALAAGAVINGAQGLLIGWTGANPIIVSIAALALVTGIAEAFARSGTVYAQATGAYAMLTGTIAGLPIAFVAFLAATALAQFILSWTPFGRNLYMIGSSFRAAEAIGVRTWRSIAGAYLWAGLFTALAGILLAVRYDSASMDYGIGYDYDAVAAVLVGGTAMKGGEGSVLRTLAGVLIIAVIQVVVLLKGLRQEWQYLISGLLVLGVIILHTRGLRGRR